VDYWKRRLVELCVCVCVCWAGVGQYEAAVTAALSGLSAPLSWVSNEITFTYKTGHPWSSL